MNKEVGENDVKKLMGKAWGVGSEKIPSDAGFNEFPQWDSLGHVSLLLALEEEYRVSIDYEILTELISMRAIIEYLKEAYCAG